jgi:hypothetical protein
MYFNLIEFCKQNIIPVYKRNKYFDRLRKHLGSSFIKVITGQRRVGKSYFLYQIIHDLMDTRQVSLDQIIYINKELDEEDLIKDAKDLVRAVEEYRHAQEKLGDRKLYIFIDEIQDIANWEKAVRRWKAQGIYEIFITGSNSKLLSGELASFLSGRFIEIELYPFDFLEVCDFLKRPLDNTSLDQYLLYGGMPETLKLDNSIKLEILQTLLDSILLRDVVRRFNIHQVKIFEKVVHYLALNMGSLFNAKNIADVLKKNGFKISLPTIISYLRYLENAFVAHSVERYNIVFKKVLEFSQKVYFNDLGLRNAITRTQLQYQSNLLENFVYLHLISNQWQVHVGQYKEWEIDFIAQRNKEILYIQVVWQLENPSVIQREFGNLLRIHDGHKKLVVGYSTETIGQVEGIPYLPAVDFLKFLATFD